MNLRGFVSWLLCCALLVAATWACWRVGRAFQAVELAAQRTAEAMAETTECKAAQWLGPPPEER